jgi:hypothetical protein
MEDEPQIMRTTFTVNIDGLFADFETQEELAGILEKIAGRLREGHGHGKAVNFVGNSVGDWHMTKEVAE